MAASSASSRVMPVSWASMGATTGTHADARAWHAASARWHRRLVTERSGWRGGSGRLAPPTIDSPRAPRPQPTRPGPPSGRRSRSRRQRRRAQRPWRRPREAGAKGKAVGRVVSDASRTSRTRTQRAQAAVWRRGAAPSVGAPACPKLRLQRSEAVPKAVVTSTLRRPRRTTRRRAVPCVHTDSCSWET